MARDIRRFMQSCSDCVISKNPWHLSSRKLLPLPVPNRAWSQLGVDFITELPASGGNSQVLCSISGYDFNGVGQIDPT